MATQIFFIFTPILGDMMKSDDFSIGLKPPTSIRILLWLERLEYYTSLRIMGSQNWWFGDPRPLLYTSKPLYSRVQWFLGLFPSGTKRFFFRGEKLAVSFKVRESIIRSSSWFHVFFVQLVRLFQTYICKNIEMLKRKWVWGSASLVVGIVYWIGLWIDI